MPDVYLSGDLWCIDLDVGTVSCVSKTDLELILDGLEVGSE